MSRRALSYQAERKAKKLEEKEGKQLEAGAPNVGSFPAQGLGLEPDAEPHRAQNRPQPHPISEAAEKIPFARLRGNTGGQLDSACMYVRVVAISWTGGSLRIYSLGVQLIESFGVSAWLAYVGLFGNGLQCHSACRHAYLHLLPWFRVFKCIA